MTETKPKKEIKKSDKPIIQALKFVFFSTGAGIIQLGSFTLFSEVFKWQAMVCHMIALALSVLFNFTLNRKFTFKAANNVGFAMFLAFLFYVPFFPFSTWYVKALNDINTLKGGEYLIEVSIMVINLFLEFLWTKFIVYGKLNKKFELNKSKKAALSAEDPSAPVENTLEDNDDCGCNPQ